MDSSLPYFSAIFDREITDFYSWSIPKGEYVIVGSAMALEPKISMKFELLKRKLSKFGLELGQRTKRSGGFLLRPDRTRQICTGQGNIALVGEAAGWISPTFAEGLSYAFKSALALAQCLLEEPGEGFERYSDRMRSLKRNIFLKNLKAPFMYHPFLRKLVMKTGMMSMKMHR